MREERKKEKRKKRKKSISRHISARLRARYKFESLPPSPPIDARFEFAVNRIEGIDADVESIEREEEEEEKE